MSRRELEEFLSSLTRAEIDDRINRLTVDEAKVLFEKFRGKSNPFIANMYDKSVGWVEEETRNAYTKLGIDTKQVHSSEINPILNTYFREPFMEFIDDDYENIEFRFTEKELDEETGDDFRYDEVESEEIKAKGNDIKAIKADSEETITSPRRSRWNILLYIAGSLLLVFIAFIAGQNISSGTTQSTSTATSPPREQVQSTSTQGQQFVPATDMPTAVFTETSFPTDTAVPSDTPLPSPSPIPTESVLFFDDFNTGESDLWLILYGGFTIVDGALTFTDSTLMIIDEKDWANYAVSFDMGNMYCQRGVRSSGVAIGLRVQDINNMVALRMYHWREQCQANWFQVVNGDWRQIPNSGFPLPPEDNNGVRHFLLAVNGDVYSSPYGTSVIIEDYLTGGVALFGDEGVTIDNFKVELISP